MPTRADETPSSTGLSPRVRAFLKALASENRQQVMLLFASGAEHTVGAVADQLHIGQSTASQQLALLRQGGILTARREGKTVHYRADPSTISATVTELQTYLLFCCPPQDA
jgi:DNA-binding transcriptional ArsR family regulator